MFMGVLWIFQGCFKEALKGFKEVSRLSQDSFSNVSQRPIREVSRGLKVLLWCFREVFQSSFTGVFQGSLIF